MRPGKPRRVQRSRWFNAAACTATAVVFLERRAGASAAVSPVDPQEALLLLVQELNVIAETANREQVASLETLVQRGAHRLTYSDLPEAVDCVRRLLEPGPAR